MCSCDQLKGSPQMAGPVASMFSSGGPPLHSDLLNPRSSEVVNHLCREGREQRREGNARCGATTRRCQTSVSPTGC